MRDLASHLSILPVIAPAANNNLGTTALVGTVIDKLGFESVVYAIVTGTLSDADATYTVLLEESDSSGSNFAAVADADLIGTEAAAGFIFSDDAKARKIGYVGNKRYTRLTVTPAAANSGDSPIAAIAILGHARSRPVA